jgi:DNA-binding NarL/FixJ family response regulator
LAVRCRPDVFIVDGMLPGLSGLDVTRQVCQRLPRTRVLVHAMPGHDADVLAAFRGGATGYILKDASLIELMQAVHCVAAGRRYLSLPLSERLIEGQAQSAQTEGRDLERNVDHA